MAPLRHGRGERHLPAHPRPVRAGRRTHAGRPRRHRRRARRPHPPRRGDEQPAARTGGPPSRRAGASRSGLRRSLQQDRQRCVRVRRPRGSISSTRPQRRLVLRSRRRDVPRRGRYHRIAHLRETDQPDEPAIPYRLFLADVHAQDVALLDDDTPRDASLPRSRFVRRRPSARGTTPRRAARRGQVPVGATSRRHVSCRPPGSDRRQRPTRRGLPRRHPRLRLRRGGPAALIATEKRPARHRWAMVPRLIDMY